MATCFTDIRYTWATKQLTCFYNPLHHLPTRTHSNNPEATHTDPFLTLHALCTLKFIYNTQTQTTQANSYHPLRHWVSIAALYPTTSILLLALLLHDIGWCPPSDHSQLSWKPTALPDNQWNIPYEYVLNCPSTVKDMWAMGQIPYRLYISAGKNFGG